MKSKTVLKAFSLIGTSLGLLIVTAEAKPDKGKEEKSDHSNKEHGHDNGSEEIEHIDKKVAKSEEKADKKEFKGPFENKDRERIVQYFSGHRDREHGLPPGLAKNLARGKRLPAGWQQRVAPGYVIDDGWWPAFQPVPYDWFPDIVVEPDTRLYWYGDRVVRVYEPRREVVDVIIVPTIHVDL